MSLKTWKNNDKPAWLKRGAPDPLFGVQLNVGSVPGIHDAFCDPETVVEFNAIKLTNKLRIIHGVSIDPSSVEWEDGQLLTLPNQLLLEPGLYYLFIGTDASTTFRSELFSVPSLLHVGGVDFSMTDVHVDSTLLTYDNDKHFNLYIY